MHRIRTLLGSSNITASLAGAVAMTLVIVSCSTSPSNPVSPSATNPDATSASAGGIGATTPQGPVPTNSTSPTPTPTPTPSPSPGIGRFTGGGHVTQEPQGKITYGLTIHCDGPDPASKTLSNNLEINWGNGQGSHKFHLLDHTLTIACTQGAPEEPPPFAPLDTLTGVGVGKFDGDEGFHITFTFVDGGEPGVDDQIAFRITKDSDGSVILDVPLTTVSGGNLQAHCDQPDHGQCKP